MEKTETKIFVVSVKFYKTGAVSIDQIRYGPSTEIARFFVDWNIKDKKARKL